MPDDEYWVRSNIRKIWFRIDDEKVQKFQKIVKRNLIRWSLSWTIDHNNWYWEYPHHSAWFEKQARIWVDLGIRAFQ